MNTGASVPFSRTGSRPGGRGRARARRLGEVVRLALAGHTSGERPAGGPRPFVVVLGRSNVGKSSLLNALLGARVARVSATPGRTRALYWYRVDETFDVVDCPGFGFARASRSDRAALEKLIEGVLTRDPRPDLALLLVDGRLGPQESDRSMALFLANAGVPTLVVATKWDAVRASERPRRRRALAAEFAGETTRPFLPVSAETGESLNDLVRLVTGRIGVAPRGRASTGAAAIPA